MGSPLERPPVETFPPGGPQKGGKKRQIWGKKRRKKEAVICRVSKWPWKGKRPQNLGQKMAENGQNVSFLESWSCWRLKLSPTGEEMTTNFAIFGQNWAKRAKFPIVVKCGENFVEITVILVKKMGENGENSPFLGGR